MARPFPDVERREWTLSANDAYDPRWSPLGDAVLYRQGARRLVRMPVTPEGNDLAPGNAEQLLEIDFHDAAGESFAVARDGRRVLVNRPVEALLLDTTPLTLVVGWAAEIARLVGPGRN